MAKRIIILGIVGVLVAAFLGGLSYFQFVFKPQMIRSFLSQMTPPPATVTAEAAKTEKWIEHLTSIGTMIASQGVDINTQVAGMVVDVSIESGQDIQEGGTLVQLDVAVETADLASNKATLDEAEVAYQRQTDLIAKRVTSEANLDTARAKRDTSAAAVKRTQAVIEQKTIKAPFAGRLGIRKVEKGQYVSPGMALVSLQALDPIRVDFPMPEQLISKLKVGQAIQLTVDTFGRHIFKGEIQSLDARVAQDTRTLLVRGLLANPDPQRKLLPGMFANVVVLAGTPADVVTVPRTAVTYSLYGDSVYVVKTSDKPAPQGQAGGGAVPQSSEPALVADRRFVRTGEARDDRVAITEGLKAGEQVITTGQVKLNPGASIRIDNTQPLQSVTPRPKQ
ncbi:MAG: efflux RND transporter periplasmic adaptor subunit [Hyphomicrobiaceae bacterium]